MSSGWSSGGARSAASQPNLTPRLQLANESAKKIATSLLVQRSAKRLAAEVVNTRVFEVSVVRQSVKTALCLLPPFKRLFNERDAALAARDGAVAARDAALAARDAAVAARDAAVAARDAAGGCLQSISLPKILVETDATVEQFHKMLGYMNRTWEKQGESEPYFSVLTAERFKMANIRENEQELFSSGMQTVSEVKAIAGRYDIDISKYKDCFELG
jgi:hypothetical protein